MKGHIRELQVFTVGFYKCDSDIVGDLKHFSKELGISKQEIIRDAIRDYVNQLKQIEDYDKQKTS